MNKFIATLLIPAVLLSAAVPAFAQSPASQSPMAPQSFQIAAESGSVLAIAQDFVAQLGQENYSSAVSKYSSGSGVSASSLQQLWQDTVAVNGSLQEQVATQVVEGGEGSQVVVITCQFEQGTRDVVINFVNGEIIDFSVAES